MGRAVRQVVAHIWLWSILLEPSIQAVNRSIVKIPTKHLPERLKLNQVRPWSSISIRRVVRQFSQMKSGKKSVI